MSHFTLILSAVQLVANVAMLIHINRMTNRLKQMQLDAEVYRQLALSHEIQLWENHREYPLAHGVGTWEYNKLTSTRNEIE